MKELQVGDLVKIDDAFRSAMKATGQLEPKEQTCEGKSIEVGGKNINLSLSTLDICKMIC